MLPMKPGAWLVLLVEPQKHDEAISELQLRVHHSKKDLKDVPRVEHRRRQPQIVSLGQKGQRGAPNVLSSTKKVR